MTWDNDAIASGIQLGNGTWNTATANWFDGTTNVTWNNVTHANTTAVFGLATATAGGTLTVSDTINLGGMRFVPLVAAPTFAHTFNGGTLAFANDAIIEMGERTSTGSTTAQFVNLNSLITGNNLTIQRTTGGTTAYQYLRFGGANPDLKGTLTLKSLSDAAGIFVLVAAASSHSGLDRVIVESGSTYAIAGVGSNYAVPITMAGIGQNNGAIRLDSTDQIISGAITMTGSSQIHSNAAALRTTISSAIGETGTLRGLQRTSVLSTNTATFTGTSTFTGPTTFGRSSTNGGVNVFDFSAAGAPVSDIFYNGTSTVGALNMTTGYSGATVLNFIGNTGTENSQRFGVLNAIGNSATSGGLNVINLTSGSGGRMDLSLSAITRTSRGLLHIGGPQVGAVSITTPGSDGFLGSWATYRPFGGKAGWARVSEGKVIGGFNGDLMHASGTAISDLTGYSAGSHLNLTNASTGNITVNGTTTELGTLTMNDRWMDRTVALPSSTLRMGAIGGVQLAANSRNLVIGETGNAGTLTAGGPVINTPGELIFTNNSAFSTLTINSIITNNGSSAGAVALQFNGVPSSKTILTGANSFTGGTTIASGAVEVRGGLLGSSGTVVIQQDAGLLLSGGIAIARTFTAGGTGVSLDGVIRNLSGNNTIGAAVALSAPTRINSDSGVLTFFATNATTNMFTGTQALTFGGAGEITVNSRIATATAGVTKDGHGTLTLGGNNTYTGATTVTGGTLRLASGQVSTTSGITVGTAGTAATLDLNGQTTDRGVSIRGSGFGNGGALINSSISTTATITGTAALAAAAKFGGAGNITINNATGLTGSVQLTKSGSGTLTFISTTASVRTTSGINQIDEGTLRLQAATALAPIGLGALVMNGGTLSLGFDASGTVGGIVNVLADSTIIADRASAGPGGTALTLSTLTMGSNALTVKPGDNVTSGTVGLTLGSVFLGGASMRPGNPTFDVQSTANAALTLTLGSFTDQFIAPRTITFQNSGTSPSTVAMPTVATALVDGTLINIANAGGAVSLNLNIAAALGTLAKVNVDSGNTLALGASQTLAALSGSGTVNASGAGFTLTVGNALNSPALDTAFSGVLINGAVPSPLTLIKAGKGTLTLSGSNSNLYTGVTTVTGGTLVLAKTGGALAVGGGLTIGNTTATTLGRTTVRLDGNDQIINTAALIMNGGSALNLNGFSQTVLTFSSAFGATVTGPGTLAVATTSGTMTFTGSNSITGNLQLTTGTAAQRTIAMTSVTDVLHISGQVTQGATTGSIAAGNTAQTALGTLILSGENSYAGTTTLSSGILNIRHGSALGTVAGVTTITAGATLQLQNDITTLAEPLTVRGTGFAGAAARNYQTGSLVNVSGTNNYAGLLTLGAAATVSSDSGTLNLNHVGTITGATFGLTLAGSGNGSIASIIGITTGAVTKNGTGTWTLKGVNTSTGAITINAGTLKLGDGSTGSWSTVPGLTFTGSGALLYGGSTAATTQALGALTLTSGAGILQVDAPASGTNAITFSSLITPSLGSGLDIVSPTNTSVTLTNSLDTNGIVNVRLSYNGSDFASSTAGLMGAAATTTATSSLAAGNAAPYLISGSFSQTESLTANAGLKFAGNDTLTIQDGILLAINNGTGTAGGILVAGGVSAVIANQGSAIGLTTDGAGDLVIRTSATNDRLTLQVPITSTTTGGLTKNGAGTLTLSAPSAYTGATSINEGTLILGNATALSGTAATVQVGAMINLNGQSITNAVTLNGAGIGGSGALINNTGTATIGALTIGFGHGTGGIGASIGGSSSIQSTGALSGNNLLVKTGTGTLTLGDNSGTPMGSTRTGTTRVDMGTLRVSNSATALGAATAQLVLNGGTLSLGTSTSVAAHPTALTASSSIISDVFTTGAGLVHTLGVLSLGDHTLTISGGSNATTEATNTGVTFGATTLLGSPIFDVQNPTSATNGTTTLTLGALNDQGIAKTITFRNNGTATTNSLITLATAAGSLMEGTKVNLTHGANAGVTLNLNLASALGTFAEVNVSEKSRLVIGAAQTIASLTGDGTVSASGAFTLTVGNANSSPALSTTFAGALTNGSGTMTFAKNGLGTLTLSGLNNYSGTTTVSAGILKLGSATALGSTSGVLVAAGGTLDLNGQSADRNFTSVIGVGHEGIGALINSSATTSTLTGTFVLGSYARIGGSGNITINNSGGITGNILLTKVGDGTLRVISATASARTGTNQLDGGTLRLEAATGLAPIGTGAMALNGGTLSLGFDTSGTVGGVVNTLADSTIISDRASSGDGGIVSSLSTLTIGGSKLTVKAGDNVTSGQIGLTLGSTFIGGAMLAGGNPVFDVQSTANATTTLTLGTLTDQAIAPRTVTFQNSSANASVVTLGTAATSLVNGTLINIASAGGAVTVNLNNATAIGTVAQVTLAAGNTLSLGASQTILSLNGGGTVTASTTAVMTIGNPLSPVVSHSVFDGVLAGGSSLSLVKAGPTSLTLGGSVSNTYSGSASTLVTDGTLILAKTGGAIAIPGNLTLDAYGSTTGAASVRLEGDQQIVNTATLTMRNGATFDLNGFSQNLASIGSNDAATIINQASSTTSTLTVGTSDASSIFLGRIVDGAGAIALVKTGTGALMLSGANNYSGTTAVQAGTIQVGVGGSGQTGTGAVTLASGTTLMGTGFVQGQNFTAESGAKVYAGDGIASSDIGTLHFTPTSGSGEFDFRAGSSTFLDISTTGASDRLNFVGLGTNTLTFEGNLTVGPATLTPLAEKVFNLLDWSGLFASPTFASRFTYTGWLYGNGDEAAGLDLPDVSASAYYWDISQFTTQGTIALVMVPEPSRLMMLLLAILGFSFRRNRSQNRH